MHQESNHPPPSTAAFKCFISEAAGGRGASRPSIHLIGRRLIGPAATGPISFQHFSLSLALTFSKMEEVSLGAWTC